MKEQDRCTCSTCWTIPVRSPCCGAAPRSRSRHRRAAARTGQHLRPPRQTSPTEGLALVPFRQIRERGFDVRDDGTPLTVLTPRRHTSCRWSGRWRSCKRADGVTGGGFDVDDEEYAGIVGRVLEEEIGRGEGANFVIRRTYEGAIPGFGRPDALALFRRLLVGERGAYWTFVVHTGERTLVGASPEVHVRMSGGTVVMNPISGTYRYPAEGPCATTCSVSSPTARRSRSSRWSSTRSSR